FFQAEDGIRDFHVTGVQTCALPILGNTYTAQSTHLGSGVLAVEYVVIQPGERRHIGFRHHDTRIEQVHFVPVIRIATTYPCQVWTGTLGAPQEGMLIYMLTGNRVVPVALHFSTQRADHLRVAYVAAFTDINIPAFQDQCRQRFQAFHRRGGFFQEKLRHDLCQAAETDGDDDQYGHQAQVLFYNVMTFH